MSAAGLGRPEGAARSFGFAETSSSLSICMKKPGKCPVFS
jgi:hypothetical protein